MKQRFEFEVIAECQQFVIEDGTNENFPDWTRENGEDLQGANPEWTRAASA